MVRKPLPKRENPKRFTLCHKIAFVIVAVIVVKTLWSYMRASYTPEVILDDDRPEHRFFPGRSCVMKNGKCIPYEEEPEERMTTKGLQARNNSFYLDGQPFRILSGSFHYFRTQPAHWGDRLMKMKAAGLNTVMTYIPWNLHEQHKDRINFGGTWDIAAFIQLAKRVGLKVIIRPGPYICAEWEYGGLPSWLLTDPNMEVRSSSNKHFMKRAELYLSQLLPILVKFSHSSRGGPIIAWQIENEFGSYGEDPKYLLALKKMFTKYGVTDLLFTSDGRYASKPKNLWGYLRGGVPGVLKTANFGLKPEGHFAELKKIQPDKPIMVTELWDGWFDHWEEQHHTFDPSELKQRVAWMLKQGASINFYMFVGGTNFGFWNGANANETHYMPTVTSYDYDAPVSECGDITKKYMLVREAIEEANLAPHDRPDSVPENMPKHAYGSVTMTQAMPYGEMLNKIPAENKITNKDLLPMEMLKDLNGGGGQGYGWIVYRTTIPYGSELTIKGLIRDRAQILVNYQEVKTILWNATNPKINLQNSKKKLLKKGNILDIFVENLGRVNFKYELNKQRKGIIGDIYLDGKKLTNWEHYPLEFDSGYISALTKKSGWKEFTPFVGPAAYKGVFTVKGEPKDTFLLLQHWTKGIVLINGNNIGRYWEVGPQQTLYVPAPLLYPGSNHVIVFDVHRPWKKVEFIDRHILGTKLVEMDDV